MVTNFKNEEARLAKENQLVDEFATFILRYKNSVEPESRSAANSMLERLFDLLHWHQQQRAELLSSLEANKQLSEKAFIEKKEAENKINLIYDEIQNLLNIPFEGKGNDLAHERIGQDKIVCFILDNILNKYKESSK